MCAVTPKVLSPLATSASALHSAPLCVSICTFWY
jgi:hypothetical protein